MYVIEVIPMRRGQHRAALSYFSKVPYQRGAVVRVPVRAQEAQGVVLSCTAVSATKAALRSATFSLRKLPVQKVPLALPAPLLATADTLAEYYAAQPGAVLFALLPNEIRNGNVPLTPLPSFERSESAWMHEVLQAPREARIPTYQSIVRESFARNESVVLVVPTVEEGRFFKRELEGGIADHVHVLHSGRGVRALRSAYATFASSSHAVLIIATPSYAFLNRHDVGTIIVERSRAFSYRGHSRPYLDFRHALAAYARQTKRRFMSADTFLRSEDELLLREDRAETYEERPKRIALPGTLKVIELRKSADGTIPFVLFSDILLDAIGAARRAKGHTFLFCARRGLAPIVACADCGFILRCPESGSPLSLHRVSKADREERWLYSSVSGYRVRAFDLCPSCGSWRLRERGIGIQQVYDELAPHFPSGELFLFDHQSASTHKKATALRDSFYSTKSAVLLGTALALPYLHQAVELSAVVSMEALRAIPSWRQHEESLGTLLTLREKTSGFVFVQTRTEDDGLIRHAQTGTTAQFYSDELAARQQFQYPPYSVFIHLTWKRDVQGVLDTTIAQLLAPYDATFYSAPTAASSIAYALVRVPQATWPNDTLVDALRSLPPSVRVIVNPDRIV